MLNEGTLTRTHHCCCFWGELITSSNKRQTYRWGDHFPHAAVHIYRYTETRVLCEPVCSLVHTELNAGLNAEENSHFANDPCTCGQKFLQDLGLNSTSSLEGRLIVSGDYSNEDSEVLYMLIYSTILWDFCVQFQVSWAPSVQLWQRRHRWLILTSLVRAECTLTRWRPQLGETKLICPELSRTLLNLNRILVLFKPCPGTWASRLAIIILSC